MVYVYRCTTDKIPDAFSRIEEAGDTVLWTVHVGGRDWVLICRKADD
jgi:hypothetical protein